MHCIIITECQSFQLTQVIYTVTMAEQVRMSRESISQSIQYSDYSSGEEEQQMKPEAFREDESDDDDSSSSSFVMTKAKEIELNKPNTRQRTSPIINQ